MDTKSISANLTQPGDYIVGYNGGRNRYGVGQPFITVHATVIDVEPVGNGMAQKLSLSDDSTLTVFSTQLLIIQDSRNG